MTPGDSNPQESIASPSPTTDSAVGKPEQGEAWSPLGGFSFGLREAVAVAVITTGCLVWLTQG